MEADDFLVAGKSINSGYDWSDYNTENMIDTWMPVSTNSGKMQHRYIPADEFTLSNSGSWFKYGRWTFARFDNTSLDAIGTCPYPPASAVYQYIILFNKNQNTWWHGWLQVNPNKSVVAYTITSLGASSLYQCYDTSSFSVYGNIVFFNS